MKVLMEQVASGIKNQLPECILGFFEGYMICQKNTILSSLMIILQIHAKQMHLRCAGGGRQSDKLEPKWFAPLETSGF